MSFSSIPTFLYLRRSLSVLLSWGRFQSGSHCFALRISPSAAERFVFSSFCLAPSLQWAIVSTWKRSEHLVLDLWKLFCSTPGLRHPICVPLMKAFGEHLAPRCILFLWLGFHGTLMHLASSHVVFINSLKYRFLLIIYYDAFFPLSGTLLE